MCWIRHLPWNSVGLPKSLTFLKLCCKQLENITTDKTSGTQKAVSCAWLLLFHFTLCWNLSFFRRIGQLFHFALCWIYLCFSKDNGQFPARDWSEWWREPSGASCETCPAEASNILWVQGAGHQTSWWLCHEKASSISGIQVWLQWWLLQTL